MLASAARLAGRPGRRSPGATVASLASSRAADHHPARTHRSWHPGSCGSAHDDAGGHRHRLWMAQVRQVGIARAVRVHGEPLGVFLEVLRLWQDVAGAAVAGYGEHRVRVHPVADLPAALQLGQLRLGVQPPVAHQEVRPLGHPQLRHADRRLPRHVLAEVARHEPAHAEALQEGVDRVLGAVVGAGVVAGKEQAVTPTIDDEALLAPGVRQAGGDRHRQRLGEAALPHQDEHAAGLFRVGRDGQLRAGDFLEVGLQLLRRQLHLLARVGRDDDGSARLAVARQCHPLCLPRRPQPPAPLWKAHQHPRISLLIDSTPIGRTSRPALLPVVRARGQAILAPGHGSPQR